MSVEGVVQQQHLDGYFSLNSSHRSDDYIGERYCVRDHANVHTHLPYWVQGISVKTNGPGSYYLKCNYQDVDICNLADITGNFPYSGKWKNPIAAGGSPSVSASINGAGEKTPNTEGGQILCTWPQNNFQNIEWTNTYLEGISKGGSSKGGHPKPSPISDMIKGTALYDQNRQTVYRSFCNQALDKPSDLYQCPPDIKTCSFYKATPKNTSKLSPQAICSTYEQVDNAGFNNDVKSLCDSENATDDCLCLNPSLDPNMKKLLAEIRQNAPNLETSLGCWFTPCGLDDVYILDKDVKDQRKICEKEPICNTIINAVARGDINIDDVKENIDCNFGGGGGGATISTTTLIIGAVVVIIIIIIVSILIYFTTGPNDSPKKTSTKTGLKPKSKTGSKSKSKSGLKPKSKTGSKSKSKSSSKSKSTSFKI